MHLSIYPSLPLPAVKKFLAINPAQRYSTPSFFLSTHEQSPSFLFFFPSVQFRYEEATELAYFGAQVLHPLAMRPAEMASNLGVRVKNSYNRSAPGTIIQKVRQETSFKETSLKGGATRPLTLPLSLSLSLFLSFPFPLPAPSPPPSPPRTATLPARC